MLLLWFNPNLNNFYLDYGSSNIDLELFSRNGFGHILIAIYVRRGLNFVNCSSVRNAYLEKEEFTLSKKNRLITHLIEFLDKKRRK